MCSTPGASGDLCLHDSAVGALVLRKMGQEDGWRAEIASIMRERERGMGSGFSKILRYGLHHLLGSQVAPEMGGEGR